MISRRTHRARRVLVAAATAAALVLTGCTPTTPGAEAASLVDTVRQLPITDDAVSVMTDVLASSGMVVVAEDAEPGTGNVTTWQVRNLATEAANGGGINGATLEELAPAPDGAPPFAFLLAAWISTYDSTGAEFSRALLGEQDWQRATEITFPHVILMLFLADAIADAEADSDAGGTPRVGAIAAGLGESGAVGVGLVRAASAAGPCTTATSFVQNAIASVANALKVNASGGGLFGFLGKIWNTAVDLGARLVTGLIDTITRPVVNLLVDVFGVVAVIAQVSSFLTQWRVTVTPDPEETRFGVIPDIVTGAVEVTVADQQLPIPSLIVDCAAAFGVDLTKIGAVGSRVVWTDRQLGRPDLAARVMTDDVLDDDRSATYVYQTGQEPPELAQSPNEHAGLLEVLATVERSDIERIRELFAHLLLDQIPRSIRGIVEPLVRPILDASTRHLAAITDVHSVGYVAIYYHLEPDPTPPQRDEAGGTQPGGGQSGDKRSGDDQSAGPNVGIPDSCPPSDAVGYIVEPTISTWESGALHCQYSPWFFIRISHGEPPAWSTRGVTLICGPEFCSLMVVTNEGEVTFGGDTEERLLEVAASVFAQDLTIDHRY